MTSHAAIGAIPPVPKVQKPYHRKLKNSYAADSPSTETDPRYLFSLPFVELIDGVADILFPPNTIVSSKGVTYTIVASNAAIHRYVLFRAVWQKDWGVDIHEALRLFAMASERHFEKAFLLLETRSKKEALSMLEDREYDHNIWNSELDQRSAFNTIHSAVKEGFFSEPGYGGNRGGLGWYYSNFMQILD